MNGLTQSTAARILLLQKPDGEAKELIRLRELDVLKIIDEAFTEHTKPHADEAENCKELVNQTNERTAAAMQEMTDALSAKQIEIIGLREQLEDKNGKLVRAADQIGELNELVAGHRKDADDVLVVIDHQEKALRESAAELIRLHQKITELQTPSVAE